MPGLHQGLFILCQCLDGSLDDICNLQACKETQQMPGRVFHDGSCCCNSLSETRLLLQSNTVLGQVYARHMNWQNKSRRVQAGEFSWVRVLNSRSSIKAASAEFCTTGALDRLRILLYLKLQGEGCKQEVMAVSGRHI